MLLRLRCPYCQTVNEITDQQRGTTIACRSCGKNFRVPPAAKPEAEPSKSESTSPSISCRLDIGSATSRGKVRTRNEDCFLVQHLSWSDLDITRETALVIVSDGLGGHQSGDQAARLVIRSVGSAMGEVLAGALRRQVRTSVSNFEERILTSIKNANKTVHDQAQTDAKLKGMAATVAVVLVWNGQVLIGHVGDCRVYHFREENLTQITKDQTLVARMVELGTLSEAEAKEHPARNEISQAVGLRSSIEPQSYHLWLKQGDTLVIASDGLTAHVDDRMLASAIRKTGYSASILASNLVDQANQGGGQDNVTVAAVNAF